MSNKQKTKISSKKALTNDSIDPSILYNFIEQSTEAQDEIILTTKALITCTQDSKKSFDDTRTEIQVSIEISIWKWNCTNRNLFF